MLDNRIYTFLAVCQEMNFTKAAKKLHITQPAVSQHIQYIERTAFTPFTLKEKSSPLPRKVSFCVPLS